MKTVLYALMMLMCSTFFLSAQEVHYPDNVLKPLSAAEKKMITEAYGDEAANQYIFERPHRLKAIKHILRNRFEIVELPQKDLSKCERLSEIPVFNVYKDVKRDQVFDLKTFNPLKYQFQFFGKASQYVAVDNTPYVIIITSQFQ